MNSRHSIVASLVPRPPPFFFVVLQFALSIASVLYTERKPKNKKRGRSGNEAILSPHLTDDVSVCEPDDETILGSVVLVLILCHKTLPGKVVSPPLWRTPSHISMEIILSLPELSGAKGYYLQC